VPCPTVAILITSHSGRTKKTF